MADVYDVLGRKINGNAGGALPNPFAKPGQPEFNLSDPAGSFAAASKWKADAPARAATARQTEFDTKYGTTLGEKHSAYSQTMLDELALAQRQAAGKLGFAMSSGPGTSGLAPAAQLALDRQFSTQRALGLGRIDMANADFKLNWNLQEDKFDYGIEMSKLQFKQQQALLQQQAELNSASWWEQLGGIVGAAAGFMIGGPVGAAVGYGVGSGGVNYA